MRSAVVARRRPVRSSALAAVRASRTNLPAGPGGLSGTGGGALAEQAEPGRATRDRGAIALCVILVGYLLLGRPFAYIGVPPVYLGEALIVGALLYPPTRHFLGEMLRQLTRPGRFHLLMVALALFFASGLVGAARGMLQGHDVLFILKNLPFNYYPVFLLLGLWAGRTRPGLLRQVTWWLAVSNAIYGTLEVAFLNHVNVTLPWASGVSLFDLGSTSSAVSLLGLLAYHRRHRGVLLVFVGNLAALLGHQVRAEWLGLLVAVAVWCLVRRHVRALVQALVIILVAMMFIGLAGLKIPGAASRGGDLSVGDVAGRAVAPFDPQLAAQFTTQQRAGASAGTADFRKKWWDAIWESAKESPDSTLLVGHGYGFDIASLAPPAKVDDNVRSPHSVFFYTLGYLGITGVLLLALLLAACAVQLWRAFRQTGDAIGLAILALMVTVGLFEPWFETPFGALPTWALLGLAMAPLLPPPPARSLPRGGARAVRQVTGRRRPATLTGLTGHPVRLPTPRRGMGVRVPRGQLHSAPLRRPRMPPATGPAQGPG